MRLRMLLLPLLATGACADAITLGEPTTALQATVVRGPIQPVCRLDPPCEDLPFAAGFDILRGATRITTARSDSAGIFRVRLAPGAYRVVPHSDAPIISPRSQVKEVTVTTDTVTRVLLAFDTGIRG
jgi:hypothetical protein